MHVLNSQLVTLVFKGLIMFLTMVGTATNIRFSTINVHLLTTMRTALQTNSNGSILSSSPIDLFMEHKVQVSRSLYHPPKIRQITLLIVLG